MGCVNNYYLVVIKVVVRQACSGDDLTSLPKNKAAFSLSSHLGLDWSFRTTASPVIVPRYFERIVSVHLYIVFVEPNDPSYFEYSSRVISTSSFDVSGHLYFELRCLGSSLLRASMSRFISTSRSIPRSISTFGPHSELLRVSAHARTRSASVRSSDAQPTNQEQAVLQQPISLSGYTKFKKLPKPCFSCPGSPTGLKSKVLKVIWSAR